MKDNKKDDPVALCPVLLTGHFLVISCAISHFCVDPWPLIQLKMPLLGDWFPAVLCSKCGLWTNRKHNIYLYVCMYVCI